MTKTKTKPARVGQKVTVLLGPKWVFDEAPGIIVDVVGDWEGYPIVNVEFELEYATPGTDGDDVIEVRTFTIYEAFFFDTAADARAWLADGHQSIGVFTTN